MTIIQQIKRKLPIGPFVAKYTRGLKQAKVGKAFFTGHCPFHQTPDDPPYKRKLWVNVNLGVCGCFVPRCQAGQPGGKPMDVINFYARLRNISNTQAVDELANTLGVPRLTAVGSSIPTSKSGDAHKRRRGILQGGSPDER